MNIYRTSDLPASANIESSDLIAISKDQGGSYISEKVTWANALGNITTSIVTTEEINTSGISIGSHVGHTHPNPLKILDSVTGLSITVYLRGGILTTD